MPAGFYIVALCADLTVKVVFTISLGWAALFCTFGVVEKPQKAML